VELLRQLRQRRQHDMSFWSSTPRHGREIVGIPMAFLWLPMTWIWASGHQGHEARDTAPDAPGLGENLESRP
jgi:hypothetical protein